MEVLKDRIYEFLNQYIESELMPASVNIDKAFVKDRPVDISGNRFALNCWREFTDNGEIVCVEVSRNNMLFMSEAYSLGVLLMGEVKKKLDQEELWNMGF